MFDHIMIYLYRPCDSQLADEVQENLETICIAHTVMTVEDDSDLPTSASFSRGDLPVLVDDGEVVSNPEALRDRVDKLRILMREWRRFQSDVCELDVDGNVC